MKMNHEKAISLPNFSSSLFTIHLLLLFCLICLTQLPTSTVSAALILRHYSNETDRIALLDFMHRISNDPLNSWNHSQHHCRWQGVSCGRRHHRVVALRLPMKGLVGTISPHIGNLTFLRDLNLSSNTLSGHIPGQIGRLFRLRYLDLSANTLTGELVAANLSNCVHLRKIIVSQNGLSGKLPTNLSTLKKLQSLELNKNQFTGGIPSAFGNFSSLQLLFLEINHLQGSIPREITQCWNLNVLYLGLNNLTGKLSSAFFNMTSIIEFSITDNSLQGTIPASIGDTMPNLEGFFVSGNKFHGTIPISFPNASKLQFLDLSANYFVGKVPGVIPSEIGNLQKLQLLTLGKIPSTLYNLTSLAALSIRDSNLYGNIPPDVKNFRNLNAMLLSSNRLSGTIPQQVFDLQSLSKSLDLSNNSFTGQLSPAVGKLKTLNTLDISRNKSSGRIPEAIGDCLSLEVLYMNDNLFEGKIPPSLISLKSITYLDISNNKLTGEIPRELQKLHLLQYLDLSFNDLEGEVPTVGVFAVATNVSLLGNKKLCGGIPELKLPPCPAKKTQHRKHPKIIVVVFACVSVALIFASFLAFLILHYCKKNDKSKEFSEKSTNLNLSKISYSYLHCATEGFNETNLIGSGSFGSVYKGRFQQGGEQIVAVKVLDLCKKGASKSFLAECKVLRNIRHRNLVPILTCCSSCDLMGNEFKALVYEFMENGDLDTWLHPHSDGERTNVLSALQRLNISIDVASALDYLHNDCEPPVIHCDLKPSNILLDKDLTAHVGDFGLSRLYSRTIGDSSGKSSTLGLKGFIGYIAPEYGMGANATTCGDVYSYGIFLLEMFTEKRPTYDFSSDGCSSLSEYVETALPHEVMKIVDPVLLACQESSNHGIRGKEQLKNPGKLVEIEESKMDDFFISVFKIGLCCASRSPMERGNMKDVCRELHKIRNAFFV
ncbi:LRR receptor-like serine/threonine-protein kinase EFR [Ipomoea triloba]|uniref:LRR receptor-like serine/threonine-protein kinase EFR n=1 Tax=Ipomoea triloba TaxID=35885 RepID=UPI00125D565F|nr:LRR receptor-like serine/threonine-protein kinase EFR [Ipomoea triloba]